MLLALFLCAIILFAGWCMETAPPDEDTNYPDVMG